MRKVVIHRAGDYRRLEIEEHADPLPGPGAVRIAVSHAGVNYADCIVRMGLYASARELVGWPITPGFEVAGTVDAVGDGVTTVREGAPVIGVTLFNGYATKVVVPQDQVFHIPAGVAPVAAAAIPVAFLTAWFALHELAHVRKGERVLVHSAAGGVGSAAVQLAVSAGCEVIGIVGAPHKLALPRELGARSVFDKSSADLWAVVGRVAPGGLDVILDANGVETLAASYAHLAPLGRLVVYGFHTMMPKSRPRGGGRPDWFKLARSWMRMPRFNPLDLTTQNKSVLAFNLSFLGDRADLMVPAMRRILLGFEDGQLKLPRVRTYPFNDVAQAQRDLESGATTGKLVLQV